MGSLRYFSERSTLQAAELAPSQEYSKRASWLQAKKTPSGRATAPSRGKSGPVGPSRVQSGPGATPERIMTYVDECGASDEHGAKMNLSKIRMNMDHNHNLYHETLHNDNQEYGVHNISTIQAILHPKLNILTGHTAKLHIETKPNGPRRH